MACWDWDGFAALGGPRLKLGKVPGISKLLFQRNYKGFGFGQLNPKLQKLPVF